MAMSTSVACHRHSHSCGGLEVKWGNNRLVYSDDWRPLHGMKELRLILCGEAKLCVLRQLCPQLTELRILGCQVSWPDVRSQWLSLRTLQLVGLDEVKLCQVAQLSPCLEELQICGDSSTAYCAVCVDDVAGQLQSLQTLVAVVPTPGPEREAAD